MVSEHEFVCANISPMAKIAIDAYHFIMMRHGVELHQRMFTNANVSNIKTTEIAKNHGKIFNEREIE